VSAIVTLSIAGSDPSGGAGIQADLKTFSALGTYGTTVITALTAQNTTGVTGVHVVPAGFVAQQLETLVADVSVHSIKIGMLANAEIVAAVAEFLARQRCGFVVLDPVMIATSGDRLLADEAVAAMRALLPAASVITPNLAEAAVLLGAPVAVNVAQMREQAHALLMLGAQRVLLKGGHLNGEEVGDGRPRGGAGMVDIFVGPEGEHELRGPRINTSNTHGTGCSLSSALAALRPQREDWVSTAREAKAWLTGALAAADTLGVGHGHGPVHHFHQFWAAQ
jgi:hydroxymethylpyrimidine/phosphomethylpyrimidine kinase